MMLIYSLTFCPVPVNTTACVVLQGARLEKVYESRRPLATAEGVLSYVETGTGVQMELGSGKYAFSWDI